MAGLSRRAGILLVVVVFLLTATLLYPFLLSWGGREPQLSAYDDDWNDLASVRKDLQRNPDYKVSSILSSVAVLEDLELPNETLMLIIGNEKGYSGLELEIIANYLREGGNLLVAGDFDKSYQLAELFQYTFDRHTLWDDHYVDNISMIKVSLNFEGAPYKVLFNQPTALKKIAAPTQGIWQGTDSFEITILAKSSKRSWLDSDNNGYVSPDDDDNDGEGEFTLMLKAHVKVDAKPKGNAVLISDASWLTESMYDREDNARFFRHLVTSLLPNGGTIIFDESVHTQGDFPSSFYQSALTFYFTLSGDTIIINILKIIAFILILYVVIYAYMQGTDPTAWFHFFRVDRYTHHPHHYDAVIPRLREVFIDRIRLQLALMDLPPPDQAEARLSYIQNALGRKKVALDIHLSQLLFNPSQLQPDMERQLAEAVHRWEP